MSNITSLLDNSLDAFTNLFDVTFIFPSQVLTNTPELKDNLSIRIQDFPFPTYSLQTYPVSYKAVTLKRFAPKITGPRKLSLTFRVDADWGIYKKFKAWKKHYMNEDATTITLKKAASLNMTDFGQIIVEALDSTQLGKDSEYVATAAKKSWTFNDVMCVNVQEPTFTKDSANPVTITVDFIYGQYTLPQ